MRYLVLAFVLFTTAGHGLAQTAPAKGSEFTGRWVLDASRSKGDKNFKVGDWADEVLVVQQGQPEIRATAKTNSGDISRTCVYFTDGRPGSDSRNRKFQPVAAWRGKHLIVKTTFYLNVYPDGSPYPVEELVEWELSKDGRTLKQTVAENHLNPLPEPSISWGGQISFSPGKKTQAKGTLYFTRLP